MIEADATWNFMLLKLTEEHALKEEIKEEIEQLEASEEIKDIDTRQEVDDFNAFCFNSMMNWPRGR